MFEKGRTSRPVCEQSVNCSAVLLRRLTAVYDGARLLRFPCGPVCLRDRGSDQIANSVSGEIRRLRDADVPDDFTVAAQKSERIGQKRSEIEAEVHPVRVRGGIDKRVARAAGETEVVRDGVHLVHEFAGL